MSVDLSVLKMIALNISKMEKKSPFSSILNELNYIKFPLNRNALFAALQ